jgi:hypothetical protein
MKPLLPVLGSACLILLSSCFSIGGGTPVYQSNAPEIRGERAISSDIELVKEVDLGGSTLGVFYSHEVYASGDAQTVLFTRRGSSGLGSSAKGTMNDYDLSETASLSVEQARKLRTAIDNYLSMDTKSLAATKMFNFELYSGILDMSAGTEKYRPFRDLTFLVVCSVTNTRKTFKTVFPTTSYDLYGRRSVYYATFELKPEQVQSLREAVDAALGKSTPAPAVKPNAGGA